jgi:hypothetical protein
LEQQVWEERARRETLEQQISDALERLARHTHAGDRPTGQLTISPWRVVRDGLQKPGELLSALTLLGLVVYAVFWLTYSSFYREFGLQPEEVGLTYTAVLVRAGIGTTAFSILFLIPIAIMGVIFGQKASLNRWGYYLAWSLFLVLLAIYWFLPDDLSGAVNTVLVAGILLLLVLMLILSLVDLSLVRSRLGLALGVQPWKLLSTWGTAAVLSVLLIAAVLNLPSSAGRRIAQSVKETRVNTGGLDVQVLTVQVDWLGARPEGLPAQPAFLHLGQADQTTILYEAVEKETYRVPSQTIVVTFVPPESGGP